MSMTVRMTNREVDGVIVVTVEGRIVLGEESHSFREKLNRVLAEGKKKIVLNMADVKYIDSTGLGALVAAHYSAKTQSASMRLCNLGGQILRRSFRCDSKIGKPSQQPSWESITQVPSLQRHPKEGDTACVFTSSIRVKFLLVRQSLLLAGCMC